MKNNITEIVMILDKSGSMSGQESDSVGGFNAMIEKQKKVDGKAYLSTVLFNHDITVVHDRVPLETVAPMTLSDFSVGGSTALMDATGRTIEHIDMIHKYIRKEDVPEHTIFVIITDGMENASKEYSSDKVKEMIEKHKTEKNWEFFFLGANIDAVETGKKFGISENRAVSYASDNEGTSLNYDVMSKCVFSIRNNEEVGNDWCMLIENHHQDRKKGKKGGNK